MQGWMFGLIGGGVLIEALPTWVQEGSEAVWAFAGAAPAKPGLAEQLADPRIERLSRAPSCA